MMTDVFVDTDVKVEKKRISFFNAWIDPLTMEETVGRIDGIVRARKPVQHVVVNVAKLVRMQEDERLRAIVNSCGIINADGQGIVWGARLLGLRLPERVTGIDLFLRLVGHSEKKGYRIYLLGAKPAVVKKVAEVFKRDYPRLEIAGCRDGYFASKEDEVAEEIRRSNADLLFVAMGSPAKEYFLNRYLDRMQVPFVMGVGGSFDIVAGVTRRAPVWMQNAGLEWLFRLMNEPGRMAWRYVSTNAIYLGMLFGALVTGKTKHAR